MIFKTIKIILKAFGILLALFIMFNVIYMYFLTHKLDTFLIKGATFQYKNFQNLRETFDNCKDICSGPLFQVQLHRLALGSGVIFAIREYNAGTIAIDDEGFKKITIWIPELKLGTYKFNENYIKGYFTAGGSAWPDNSCGSEIKEGALNILKIEGDNTQIQIRAKFVCRSKNGRSEKEISLDNKYDLTELGFNDISPWIGKNSDSIYEETYRR